MTVAPASRASHRRVALNFLGHVTAQVFSKLYPVIVYPYAEAKLGTAALGRALFAVALVDWTSPLTEAGTSGYGQIEVGARLDQKPEIARLMGRIVLLRMLHAALALVALAIAVGAFYFEYRLIVAAISFMIFTSVIDSTYVQTGAGKIWSLSVMTVVSKLITLALVFWLVAAPSDDATFAVLIVAGNSAYSVATFIITTRLYGFAWPRFADVRTLYRPLAPFFGMVVCLYALEKFDFLIVEALHDAAALGLYGGASRLFLAMQAMVPALVLAFGAEMLNQREAPDLEALAKHVRFALGAATLFVMPIAVGVWFVGGDLLALLYDDSFRAVGRPLGLMCLSMIPQISIIVYGVYLLSILRFTPYVCACLVTGLAAGATFASLANARLGLGAIAAGLVVAKTVAAIGLFARARKHLQGETFDLALKNMGAALVMGVVLKLAGQRGLLPNLLLGATVFTVAVATVNRGLLARVLQTLRSK